MSSIPSQPHGCPSWDRTKDRGFKVRCLPAWLRGNVWGDRPESNRAGTRFTAWRVSHFTTISISMMTHGGIEPSVPRLKVLRLSHLPNAPYLIAVDLFRNVCSFSTDRKDYQLPVRFHCAAIVNGGSPPITRMHKWTTRLGASSLYVSNQYSSDSIQNGP